MQWNKLSFSEQLGNIGSEISRANYWARKNDIKSRNNSLVRALDLIDQTLTVATGHSKLRELTRLREVLADFLAEQNSYKVSLDLLEQYCLPFAILARS